MSMHMLARVVGVSCDEIEDGIRWAFNRELRRRKR
jgi:hypothetical protein